jgi:hypothetical protein
MAVMDGKGILAKDNLNVNSHPFWSQISVLDVSSNGSMYGEYIWVDPKIWDMDQLVHLFAPLQCQDSPMDPCYEHTEIPVDPGQRW